MKTVHFISGLPRSGSTLLVNLLAQNPRFQVGGTSPLVDMLLLIRAAWDRSPEAKAMDPEEAAAARRRVMMGMFAGYYPHQGVAFDKSRSWLAHLEMAEALLRRKVKVIVPVRDVRDVLASFELLWRKATALRQIEWEQRNYHLFQTAPGRCQVWMAPDGPVGIAYARIRDAIQRGFGDRMLLVPYEALTGNPADTLARIYEFLGETPFAHNFDDVDPVTREDDRAYGFPGLHDMRRKVEASPSRWRELLGDAADQYAPLNAFLFPQPQGV